MISCKLKQVECLLLDPSSHGIDNLALHFTFASEECKFMLNGFYQIFTNYHSVFFF